MLDVHSIVRRFLQWAALDEVNLLVELELLPLTGGWELLMEDDNRSQLLGGIGAERLDEVLDILNKTTDDDVINCKHVLLERSEDDIILLDLLLLALHDHKISIDILNINISIFIVFNLVEVSCNDSLLNFVKALEVEVAFVSFELLLTFFEYALGLGLLSCDNISEVSVLVTS